MTSLTRVCLFTDTLGDVNGVSRFIRNVAEQALETGRELHAISSTRFVCPDQPNIHNPRPRWAGAMPKYPQLEVVAPPRRTLFELADRLRPDVVHVSTPGPVGVVGRKYARSRGLPLVGTYHTDFPAYIEHLFDDAVCTWACSRTMRWFYGPFARVFTRSDEYAAAMGRVGIGREKIERLLPGIDTRTFHASHRDATGAIWARQAGAGVRAASLKVLYVGRVSVEKNLPMLSRVWARASAECRARGLDAQLVIVGDGPYRAPMKAELARVGADACFLGFRHGQELSTIYASSDLFVFPSTTDTLGQVVMEAQSAGLPVIVTDKGGPSGVVDAGRTGYVINDADERAWAAAIVNLVQDPGLRRTMGAAAHAKIQPMSIRGSFEHFWEVHEEVARSRKKRVSGPA
jgi:glycosyltransferase involved in cell wall biosynthesis